ncbi:MAG: hypothetical protein PHW34_16350 [Hespellia sp.]|nr:hypothetical protein [Hespellia sp.]
MSNFDEDIKRITDEVLSDGTVDQIIREKVVEGFSGAIDNAFRWGELNKAIEKKVKDTMVPYIAEYDMSDYTLKLESVLSEIIRASEIPEQSKILENFKCIMTDVPKKEWTLKELLDVYKEFAAEKIDTDGMEIDYDDGVSYGYFEVSAEVSEEEDKGWYKSCFTYGYLDFKVDADNDDENENIQFRVNISKFQGRDSWEINFRSSKDLDGLRYMSDFEVFLMRLSRYNCRIVGNATIESDEVLPKKEPEPSFS